MDLQEANKKLIVFKVFLLMAFWRYIYIIFKDKKSKRSHKTVEIKVFLTIFAWWWKDSDPDPHLWLVDPDPGGPKTCGSGSGTLGREGRTARHHNFCTHSDETKVRFGDIDLTLNTLSQILSTGRFFLDRGHIMRQVVLRIHDILVWIRIRGSMHLTSGSWPGSGSCYFRH